MGLSVLQFCLNTEIAIRGVEVVFDIILSGYRNNYILDRSSVSYSKSRMIMTYNRNNIGTKNLQCTTQFPTRFPMQAEFLDVDGDGLEDVVTARCECLGCMWSS